MSKTPFLCKCLQLTTVSGAGGLRKSPLPCAGPLEERSLPGSKPFSFLLKRYRYKAQLEPAEKQLIK